MKYCWTLLVLISMLAVVGCSDEAGEDNNGVTIADAGSDDVSSDDTGEDVHTIGDVSQDPDVGHRCGDDPIADWPLHDEVASGDVSAATSGETTTLTIEATAGGSQAAAENPFIYVNLGTGEKVELTDLEALSSSDWDLAFKRYIIRSNGADSGPGDVSVAKESDTSFAEVTSAPSDDGAYEQDISYDDNCDPMVDPIGTLMTAFNHLNLDNSSGSESWYSYGGGISPVEGDIYVVDVPSREKTYKLEIDLWEDGVFTVHVAEL